MKFEDKFSKREIKCLNNLPKMIKAITIINLLIAICWVILSIIHLRLAVRVGNEFGLHGLMDVLSVWYQGFEMGKPIPSYKIYIAQQVASAHVTLGYILLWSIFFFTIYRACRFLSKCWKALSDTGHISQTTSS